MARAPCWSEYLLAFLTASLISPSRALSVAQVQTASGLLFMPTSWQLAGTPLSCLWLAELGIAYIFQDYT